MLGDMALVAFLVAIPFAAAAAYFDLKTMEIPHWVAPVAAVIFAVVVFVGLPMEAAISRVVGAVFVLGAGFLLWLAKAMGAGDVKLAAAYAILIAPVDAGVALVLLSVCAVISVIVIWVLRRTPLSAGSWEVWSGPRHFPYALALGQALLIYLALAAFFVR